MDDLIELVKTLTLFGGGGIVGMVIMSYKLKSEMVSKVECRANRAECSGHVGVILTELKDMMESMRADVYVIRTKGE